jgi:hypothetical protein
MNISWAKLPLQPNICTWSPMSAAELGTSRQKPVLFDTRVCSGLTPANVSSPGKLSHAQRVLLMLALQSHSMTALKRF